MKNNKFNIQNLPNKTGVYLFKNNEDILYIGKAKNIKKRISQYLNGSLNSYKTPILLKKSNKIDYLICDNEKESLLLEQELIKKYKPQFNILFVDDKKYPYIVIELKKDKLEFKTKFFYKQSKNIFSFGPLPPNYGYKTIKNFLIRECLYENGLPIVSNNYSFWKEKFEYAKKILSSSNKEIIKKLKNQMSIASENEQFELAKDFRDVIEYLTNKKQTQSIVFNNNKNFDVIVFKEEDNFTFVLIHRFIAGNFFIQEDFSYEIFLNFNQGCISFINSYYLNRNKPDFIISNVSFENEDNIFDIEIIKPNKGRYMQTIKNALNNLNENIKIQKINIQEKTKSNVEIKKMFFTIFQKEINNFLVIDNSNENNEDIVSVIIFYKHFLPFYSNYRKYKIDKEKIQRKSDVEYINYGLTKYFSNKTNEIPDLLIVDGGIQQINEAKKVLKKFNLNLSLMGLVKNEKHKTNHILTIDNKKILLNNNYVKNFFTKIQEEVDKYAKHFHSKIKINSSLEGFLLTIKGIGEQTEKKLLDYFKTYSNIYNASLEELQKIVSKKLSYKIIEKLKKIK